MKITLTRLLQQFNETPSLSFFCYAIAQVHVGNTTRDWRSINISGLELFCELRRVAPKFFSTHNYSDLPNLPNLLDFWMDWPTIHSRPELSKFAHPHSGQDMGAIQRNHDFRMALLTAMLEEYGDHEIEIHVE